MDCTPFMIMGLCIIGISAYHVIMTATCKSSCRRLNRLGKLEGMRIEDIVGTIGEPDSMMSISSGSHCQWVQFGYHLSLTFDEDGVCTEVDSLKTN